MNENLPARLKMAQTRNVDAVDTTLKTLKPGTHRILRDDAGAPVVTPDKCWVIETDNPGFCEFACRNQGYADIVDRLLAEPLKAE